MYFIIHNFGFFEFISFFSENLILTKNILSYLPYVITHIVIFLSTILFACFGCFFVCLFVSLLGIGRSFFTIFAIISEIILSVIILLLISLKNITNLLRFDIIIYIFFLQRKMILEHFNLISHSTT